MACYRRPMGRGEANVEAEMVEVERSTVDDFNDLVGPTDTVALLKRLSPGYFLRWRKEEEEAELREQLDTHPCGEPLYSSVYTSSLFAYRIGWELRDSGATLEEADKVCEQVMRKLGGGAGGILIFWAGWDDRGDGPECVRRWHSIR